MAKKSQISWFSSIHVQEVNFQDNLLVDSQLKMELQNKKQIPRTALIPDTKTLLHYAYYEHKINLEPLFIHNELLEARMYVHTYL